MTNILSEEKIAYLNHGHQSRTKIKKDICQNNNLYTLKFNPEFLSSKELAEYLC